LKLESLIILLNICGLTANCETKFPTHVVINNLLKYAINFNKVGSKSTMHQGQISGGLCMTFGMHFRWFFSFCNTNGIQVRMTFVLQLFNCVATGIQTEDYPTIARKTYYNCNTNEFYVDKPFRATLLEA